jgi:hypothetical protein
VNTRSPQTIHNVRQWGHGARLRSVFLLAALASSVDIAPDPVTIAYAANAPEVTTEPSPIIVRTQTRAFDHPVITENASFIQSSKRAQWLLAITTASVETQSALAVSRTTHIDRVTVVRSSISNAVRALTLSAIGVDPANVDVPTLSMPYSVQTPGVDSFDLIPCALQDDGVWFPPEVFMQRWSPLLLFADTDVEAFVSPDALAMTFATIAPTVTISSNALVSPPQGVIVYTAIAPSVVVDGAPIVDVPSLTMAYTVVDPEVVGVAVSDKVGGDDAYHRRPIERVEVLERTNENLKRGKLKLKREQQIADEIAAMYRALNAEPETAAKVEAIVAPVVTPLQTVDAPVSAPVREPTVTEKAEILTAKVAANEPAAVDAEIALRLLYEQQQSDDEDERQAIEVLLSQLL